MSLPDHLVVNVEEQIAKRFVDAGLMRHARSSIARAKSLPNDTRFEDLEYARRVPVTKDELRQRQAEAGAGAMDRLRDERNKLLAASDWTQGADSPLDDKSRKAWVAYRQKLRDLPEQTKDPAAPKWPAPPAATPEPPS